MDEKRYTTKNLYIGVLSRQTLQQGNGCWGLLNQKYCIFIKDHFPNKRIGFGNSATLHINGVATIFPPQNGQGFNLSVIRYHPNLMLDRNAHNMRFLRFEYALAHFQDRQTHHKQGIYTTDSGHQ